MPTKETLNPDDDSDAPGDDADATDAEDGDDGSEDGELDEKSADSTETPAPDVSAALTDLSKRLAELTDQTAGQRRQLGQVSGNQKAISKAENALAQNSAQVKSLSAILDVVIGAMDEDLTPAVRASIADAKAQVSQADAIASAVEQIRSETQADVPERTLPDGLTPHAVASLRVHDYAAFLKLTPAEEAEILPPAVWVETQQVSSSFDEAIIVLKQKLDAAVEQKAATGRRNEKKAAGQKTGSKAKTGGGTDYVPTKAELDAMTLEEVQALPRDVRHKAAAQQK